jgi:anti-sigma regulatory factor (Ser/Thr protein kinase)
MTTLSRRFDVTKIAVAALDDWIAEVGRQWNKNPRTVFAARLCVAELASNAVLHGVTHSDDDHLVVTLRCCDDGIEIEFIDTLAPFDPTSVAIPNSTGSSDVAKASIGGRGLLLIAAYSEDVAYRHDGLYNRATLKVNSEQPNLWA